MVKPRRRVHHRRLYDRFANAHPDSIYRLVARIWRNLHIFVINRSESLALLEIDHIIPEHFCNKPDELRNLLERLGVPDLKIHSYSNWLPVHGRPCNRQKGDQVFLAATLLNYLCVAPNTPIASPKKSESYDVKTQEKCTGPAGAAFRKWRAGFWRFFQTSIRIAVVTTNPQKLISGRRAP